MKRIFLLNLCILCALYSFAQESVSDKVNSAFKLCFSDIAKAKDIIKTIDEPSVATLPDSSRFDYHYVCAGIASAEDDYEGIIRHLQETKRLCETSIGVREVVYLEIMATLASAYEDNGDLDNALAIYQEGIVKGLLIRNWEGAKEYFAQLNSGLAFVYEEKGWQKEVPSLWRDAWDFWEKVDKVFEIYNVYPLFMLSDYYERKGEYDKALEINKEMSDYVLTQASRSNPVWCDILYQKGTILGHLGKHEEAIINYKEGINIAKQNGITGEIIEHLYGNLICSFAEYETTSNIDIALTELQMICPQLYTQALFSVSYILEKNKRYKDAINYISQAIYLVHGKDKEKYEWYKGLYTHEYKNQQELEKLTKTPIPNRNTSEWFFYMERLANAYYVDKNKEKAKEILVQMVNESIVNKCHESEKNKLINLLVSCAADVNDYTTVLKFSKEWIEYAKKNFGEQSKEYFACLNTTAVGYIKTNDYKHAKSILQLCTPLCITLFSKESEQYAIVLHNTGRTAQLAGDLTSAKAYYLESLSKHSLVGTPSIRTKHTREYLGEVELLLKEQL